MALKDIVDVQIDRQTAAITRVGFGTALFIYTAASGEEPATRTLTYGDIDEVDADFETSDPAYLAMQAAFSGDIKPARVKVGYKASGETWADAITAIQGYDNDWYAVAIDSAADQDIEDVAQVIESMNKLFIAKSADEAILDPNDDTDIASVLLNQSYSRTGMIYHSDAALAYPDMAWLGGQLPEPPGSITWAFKTLPGIPGESFTGAQITAIESKRVTRYETVGGVNVTLGATTFDSGAYIDVIRGIDWVRQRMSEDMFDRLANAKKIPYTNAGIAVVESVVRNRLQLAVDQDVLADDENLTVSVPRVADTEATDRANRVLRNVNFTARLAGAFHKIIVRGTVTA